MLEAEKKEAWEWIKSILVAVVLALVIRAFLVEVFLVQGESMLPTLDDRERLIVSKVQYYYREPEIGEIIVFQASDQRDFIKRVIGGPGDEVRIDTDGVYVNGEKLDEPYVLEDARQPFQTVVVPEDALFVLGDNRNNSMDSRHPSVDFVSFDSLKGKAMFVFWPLDRIRLLSHP
ncbi:signal peptidase I [Dethiobacter alkaliphilus]|uniref:signal peptidase I n=1 Tax=Dethiobacter alkaliphilus TaxID=427926 RepID=UPI0022260628|nr:signal peptidase I [Dethiobacter alkaliphilus]MCW3489948.1 signal peptidase I [Dethiobacter alkaliphilus]